MTSLYKVQTKHLNEHSTLYGGQLLEWIDNYLMAKTEDYKKEDLDQFVTRHLECDFLKPAFLGDRIRISTSSATVGKTSLTFEYAVHAGSMLIAEGKATFVRTQKGKKLPIQEEMP